MIRFATLIFALAACAGATAAPALCAGGVLVHACPCAEPPGCAHEEGCSVDPCSTLAARTDAPAAGTLRAPAMPAGLAVTPPGADPAQLAATPQPPPLPRLASRNLPCPPSDLPLLS